MLSFSSSCSYYGKLPMFVDWGISDSIIHDFLGGEIKTSRHTDMNSFHAFIVFAYVILYV